MNNKIPEITSFELNKLITTSRFFSKVSLSPGSKLVLRCIVDFWNQKKGYAYPKQTTIAECTGISKVSVSKIIEELKAKQLITVEKQGHRYKYYLTDCFFSLLGYEVKDTYPSSLSKFNSEDKQNYTPILKNKEKNIINPSDKRIKETKELVKSYKQVNTASPYDDYACAVRWLASIKEFLPNNRFFQEKAKEVQNIWNLDINNLPNVVTEEKTEE